MLEKVLRYMNNRFDRDAHGRRYGSKSGKFKVEDGALTEAVALDGQYYWIEGSVLNDGLHQHPDTEMNDEEFEGRIVLLVVPKDVVDIAASIEKWMEANRDVVNSPYQSESFGGYSYSKASGGSQGNESPSSAWQIQFGSELRKWKKINRDWV